MRILADSRGSMFAFFRIIADSCWPGQCWWPAGSARQFPPGTERGHFLLVAQRNDSRLPLVGHVVITPFSTRRMSLRNTNNSLAAGFLPLDSRLPALTTGAIPEVPHSSASDVWEPIASD